jgi:hypothetical protein
MPEVMPSICFHIIYAHEGCANMIGMLRPFEVFCRNVFEIKTYFTILKLSLSEALAWVKYFLL